VGETGKRHFEKENKIEVVVPKHLKSSVVDALLKAHPYEEVAYDLYKLENTNQQFGAGMVGELATEMSEEDFLQFVKKALKTDCIRYTALLNKPVKRVAFCGGSGSFLLNDAIAAGADVFITGDFKYHQFFDADKKLVIADVGHFESEQFTIDLLADYLMEKFPTFAVLKTEVNTNPIAYI
jgi:putative NIF3 family GTP cyclohydrolase 1 type 2